MNSDRIRALLSKEFADVVRNKAALLPVALTASVCVALPFFVSLVIPAMVGEPLSSDASLRDALEGHHSIQNLQGLAPDAIVLAFIFEQFLTMFLLIPVTGAMAFAAYSVIGEKQGRTLEPLLATPLTTVELLIAKTIASLVPSLLIMLAAAALYAGGVWLLAGPAVLRAIFNPRMLALLLVLGPFAALAALEMAVAVSSRVQDARTAQQIGVLIILPITGVMVAQFSGVFWLTLPVILWSTAGMAALAVVLMVVGVAVFDREAILTRWK
jgi:ABC-2 type transport system permease protein